MSHPQPGYVLSRQVPPRSSAASRMWNERRPALLSSAATPSPLKPAPTIRTSTSLAAACTSAPAGAGSARSAWEAIEILCGRVRRVVDEPAFEDLSGGITGEFRGEAELGGHLVAGQRDGGVAAQ